VELIIGTGVDRVEWVYASTEVRTRLLQVDILAVLQASQDHAQKKTRTPPNSAAAR
jgi:hypothetical protein